MVKILNSGVEIKLNVQSTGPTEFIFDKATSISVLSIFLNVINELKEIEDELKTVVTQLLQANISEIKKSMDKPNIKLTNESTFKSK